MRLSLQHIEELGDLNDYQVFLNKKDKAFTIIYNVIDKNIIKTLLLTNEYLQKLKGKNITDVSIYSDEKIIKKLRELHPDIYARPMGKTHLSELIAAAQIYQKLNQKCTKNRRIVVLQDIYCTGGSGGNRMLALEYNSALTDRAIDTLRTSSVSLVQECEYLDSEDGVLVFVPDVKDFKLKVDLFALISSLDYQIFDAGNVEEAIQLYVLKQPKLVVLGNVNESIDSKEFLLELDEFDPFAKKLIYDVSPASNRNVEIEKIKKNYVEGYEKALEMDKKDKGVLSEQLKNTILDGIKTLQNNWSKEDYIEKAYALKQLGRVYNISVLWNIIAGIKKSHEQQNQR